MTSSTSWNVTNAKTIFAKLTKIANEQLDVAAEPAEDASWCGWILNKLDLQRKQLKWKKYDTVSQQENKTVKDILAWLLF